MQTRISRSISDIRPESWDEAAEGETKLKSWAFLRAAEGASINQASCSYVLVFSGQDCVGTSVCNVVHSSLVVLARGFLLELTKNIRKVVPGFLTANVAVGGTLISSCTNCLSYRENDAVPMLIQGTEQIARDREAGFVLFKDFSPEEVVSHHPTFTALGYHRVPSLPGAAIEVAGASSMDHFLARFRHKYRNMIRKDLVMAQHSGLEVRNERRYGDRSREFIHLYRQVLDHAPSHFGILTPAFVDGLARHMGDASFMKIFSVEDQVVALELFVEDGEVLRPLYLGMDYNTRPDGLYYACLYHTLQHGIEHGYKRIELGQKSYEAKARYGACPWPTAMYVKHLHPTVNKLLAYTVNQLFPPADMVGRTVLKKPNS